MGCSAQLLLVGPPNPLLLPLLPGGRRMSAAAAMAAAAATTALAARPCGPTILSLLPTLFCTLPLPPGLLKLNRPPKTPLPPPPAAAALWLLLPLVDAAAGVLLGSMLALVSLRL
jgi:hypothetical protein